MSVFPLLEKPIINLTKEQQYQIGCSLQSIAEGQSYSSANLEHFIIRSFALVSELPAEIITALLQFRRQGNEDGVLLIRGLAIDDQLIGPTPSHWSDQHVYRTRQHFETEAYLLGITSVLGEVFSFSTQHKGNMIQNIVPLKTDAYEQVGTGSRVFLDWHTEDAFHEWRADYIGLLCLRSQEHVATTFASVRKMQLPEKYKRVLFEPRFLAGIDKAHGGSGKPEEGPRISILTGAYDDPCIRVDTSCICPLPGDAEAAVALDRLQQEIPVVAQQTVLRQGDLLIMDNQRVLHGRTEFTPRYDGTDRWLQRVSIAANLQKSSTDRTNHSSVIQVDRQRLNGHFKVSA